MRLLVEQKARHLLQEQRKLNLQAEWSSLHLPQDLRMVNLLAK